MTKPFSVMLTCPHCQKQMSAETAFGRWMRNHPGLKSQDGIVRTDTDHTILRYKTHEQGRDFQLMIDLEVKEWGAEPDPAQEDILSFKCQLVNSKGRNVHGAPTVVTKDLRSRANRRKVRVRYMGLHLLQFEKTSPYDSSWIKWNHKLIDERTLVGLLALDLDPYDPGRSMATLLRDRHKLKAYPLLDSQFAMS